jgi:hypothetical protein
MRFYTNQHKFYCGIDLHARSMYLCILDQEDNIVLHKNYPATPEAFLKAIQPYREDVVVECMFVWYWLADLCSQEKIPFVRGHALYMKAIHGGKSKNDKIDSKKIAALLRGGTSFISFSVKGIIFPLDKRRPYRGYVPTIPILALAASCFAIATLLLLLVSPKSLSALQ